MDFLYAKENIAEHKYKEALAFLCGLEYNHMNLAELREVSALFGDLPTELRQKSSAHLTQSCYVSKMLGDMKSFEHWYNCLVALRDGIRGFSSERDSLDNCISRVNVMRPKTNNAQTLILLSTLLNDGETGTKAIAVNATGKRPSVLRGTKDCSEWGKYYKAVRSIISPVLTALSNFDGKCAIELAVGELCLERGDYNGAVMSLGVAINSEQVDIKYAAKCVLAKLYMLEGEKAKADELMQAAVKIVEDSNAHYLQPNLQATLADMAISQGDKETVEKWLHSIDATYTEKLLPETDYINLIRAKALMSKGEWREAALLLQGLTDYFDELARTLDAIECRILCAITMMQLDSDDKATEMLSEAIEMAKPYSYTTVFADKGKLMFRLIGKYQKMYPQESGQSRFFDSISSQTKQVSMKLPAKFDFISGLEEPGEEMPVLTDTELRILQMIDEGASNKIIGVDLQIKLTTVKFHIKNIFEKFNVASRVELLKKARILKILS